MGCSEMVEQVTHDGAVLAIIVRSGFAEPGVHFFTPDTYSQQLAYMHHPAGKAIEAHTHNLIERRVMHTQEVLVIKSGRLRVDFFSPDSEFLESRVLEAGDTILLASGGHGFEALEELEMLEIKQGPYAGDQDKVRLSVTRPCSGDGTDG
jgi:mannose-6-phosphate isomerase-like protein (cupin superfamily)